jgi:crotonobetaine/carnitine-CoA ligase
VTAFEELADTADVPPPPVVSAPGETGLMLFTSGSTGPSKACQVPHRYVVRQPEIFTRRLGIGPDDVLYAPFPLFHVDAAIFTVAAAFSVGATAALAPRFSVSRFWPDCRRHGAAVFDFMGATLALLHRQPPSPGDADNPVRLGWGVPAPPWAGEFEQRFGLELVEVYGLSDAGVVLCNGPRPGGRAGSCGQPIPPFDVRVSGPDGVEVPAGEIGELTVRSSEPHLIISGYHRDPEATAAAFRDG